jgi:hypothetical protein
MPEDDFGLAQQTMYEGGSLIVLQARPSFKDVDKSVWKFVEKKMLEGFKLIQTPREGSLYIILWKEPQ